MKYKFPNVVRFIQLNHGKTSQGSKLIFKKNKRIQIIRKFKKKHEFISGMVRDRAKWTGILDHID